MSAERYKELRKKHKRFIYEGCDVHTEKGVLYVSYRFEIEGLRKFVSKWEFPYSHVYGKKPGEDEAVLWGRGDNADSDPILRRLILSLGMVEAISYYKTACPEEFVIKAGKFTDKQLKFWKHLFHDGLGEFLYLNGIDDVTEDELLTFADGTAGDENAAGGHADSHSANVMAGDCNLPLHDPRSYQGFLVPVGGGKDSVVSLELLKGEDIVTYVVNGNVTTRNVIDVCDHKSGTYTAKRILDKQIIELNSLGYLNGHIPFSAVLAFSAVISAYLSGRKYIALSNENSANETTVKGSYVNHQYSKSFEFERDFREYISDLTDSDIHYFSFLRPLAEIQIAALFSGYTAYHKAFRSCNRGSKEGIWCCDCPKCLFVNIILLPFLNDAEILNIFGEKLLDKESLDKDFRELTGIDENKPFECVGTRSEVQAALSYYVSHGGKSLLTDRYIDYVNRTDSSALKCILHSWNDENGVPDEIIDRVREGLDSFLKSFS